MRELNRLFEHVPPEELRADISTLFRSYFVSEEQPLSEEARKMVADFYYLDLFLEAVVGNQLEGNQSNTEVSVIRTDIKSE